MKIDRAKTHNSIETNSPIEINVGRKTYRVKRHTNSVQGKIDILIIDSQFAAENNDGSAKRTKQIVRLNRKLIPKVISLLILAHPIKIWIWHWIHWRWLSLFHYTDDWVQIITQMYDGVELRNFYQIIQYLQANTSVVVDLAKMNTQTIRAKHESAQETTK